MTRTTDREKSFYDGGPIVYGNDGEDFHLWALKVKPTLGEQE